MVSKAGGRGSAQFLMLVASGYILLCVALLNGYPILFADSGEYIVKSFNMEVSPYRTIFYSLFIRFTSLGISPWLVIVAQSAITVFVLLQCIEFLFEHKVSVSFKSSLLMGVVVALSCGTSLPWFVGQLMPDIFTGLLIICLFLLLYDSQLTTETSIYLAFVIMISIACHVSHLLISGVILVAIGGLRLLRSARFLWPTRSKRQISLLVLVPILTGALAVAVSNRRDGMGFVLSPGGHMFLLGRLFESGMAGSFLRRDCKLEPLSACRYLDNLPPNVDEFVWGDDPVFKAMGGWLKSKPEATRIIVGTIRSNPGWFLVECLKQTFRQFVRMSPGAGNAAYLPFLVEDLKMFYPQDTHKWELSRQCSGTLSKLANRVSRLNIAAFWGSMGCCLLVFAMRGRYPDGASKLFVFVLIALLANALITASLSEVSDRYQSRASWLMGFCLIAYVLSMLARRPYTVKEEEEMLQGAA